MKEIYEMKGAGRSVRGIARERGVARNTVRCYPNSPEAMRPKPRSRRSSNLDAYVGYIDCRLGEGLDNCVVLHRDLRERGYDGGYSILKAYVSPRRHRQPRATMRFETDPESKRRWTGGASAMPAQTAASTGSGRSAMAPYLRDDRRVAHDGMLV